MSDAAPRTPRERLLNVAGRLFYAEGIRAVGIDRVIAEASVAKATLYAHFAGKEDLVAGYLDRRSESWRTEVGRRAAGRIAGTASALSAPFEVLADRVAEPGYRGCPFINASAEFPDPGPVATGVHRHRQQVQATFAELLGADGADPGVLGAVVALYDGAMSAAYLDRDGTVVEHARAAAVALADAASRRREDTASG